MLRPFEKTTVFTNLLPVVDAEALWLTLAFEASVTDLAANPGGIPGAYPQNFPARLVGLATLPPWKERKLVEVIPGLRSSAEAVQKAEAVFRALGKETVVVGDGPGGVFPRILAMIVSEAAFAVEEGVAAAEDIDTALKLGANYPVGPLALADDVGLDVLLTILSSLHEEGEDTYRPAPLLRRMVQAGWTGRAAGRGFHTYGTPGSS